MKVCYRCHQVETRKGQAYCTDCLSTRRKSTITPDKELARKIGQHHQRAKRFGVASNFTADMWCEIVEQASSQCVYCHVSSTAYDLVPDHVIPMSGGGPNTPDNIVPSCSRCNSRKAQYGAITERELRVDPIGSHEVVISHGSLKIRVLTCQIPDLISKLSEYTP